MKIVMAGIDHFSAELNLRERFSFTTARRQAFYRSLLNKEAILGAVLISTCNRTELYLSCKEQSVADPVALLCEEAGVNAEEQKASFRRLENMEAFRHLCRLACGVQSQIWGEDQIISQVKRSLVLAREQNMVDSVLEVLFRTAITAAKRIKTELRFTGAQQSVATKTLELLQQSPSVPRKVLVIGNGEVGRMVSRALAEAGFEVTVTLRQYRHGAVEVPFGAHAVDYAERYKKLEEVDAVVSATASPHCTLERNRFAACRHYPKLLVDLAVPRDIDQEIARLPEITLYNIDDLAQRELMEDHARQLLEVEKIIDRYQRQFKRWLENRELTGARKTHFPLFVDMRGKTVLVVGGGKVADRRVRTLSRFACTVRVVAPEVSRGITQLAEQGLVELARRGFAPEDLDGVFFVVAATNLREVNRQIGVLAKQKGIFVSVADCAEECDVYFPAIAEEDGLVAGISGDGVAHGSVAAAARRIREVLHEEA